MKILHKIIRFLAHFLSSLIPQGFKGNMLNCQEVAYILANTEDLSGSEFKKLRMHLFLCEACENYRKQISKINASSQELGNIELTDQQMERIKAHQSKLSNK